MMDRVKQCTETPDCLPDHLIEKTADGDASANHQYEFDFGDEDDC